MEISAGTLKLFIGEDKMNIIDLYYDDKVSIDIQFLSELFKLFDSTGCIVCCRVKIYGKYQLGYSNLQDKMNALEILKNFKHPYITKISC